MTATVIERTLKYYMKGQSLFCLHKKVNIKNKYLINHCNVNKYLYIVVEINEFSKNAQKYKYVNPFLKTNNNNIHYILTS